MKKVFSILIVAILVVCMAACNSNDGPSGGVAPPSNGGGDASSDSGTAPSGDVLTLKMAHGHAPGSLLYLEYQSFVEALEELSGGTITVEVHPGGSLLTDNETFQGVMDGIVDFVHATSTFTSGTVKDLGLMEMYGYWNSDDWGKLLTDTRPMISDIYEPFGVKFLGAPYCGKLLFLSDKQVLEPSDLNGLTFRSAGTWYGRCVENMGAAATTLPLTDVSTALERGTVNGTILGWNLIYPWSFYELAPYITETDAENFWSALLMNMDTFNSLTEEQQGWVVEAGYIFESESERIGREIIEEYKTSIEEGGKNTIVHLDVDQQMAFLDLVIPLYDEMTELSGPGMQLRDYLLNELEAFRNSN